MTTTSVGYEETDFLFKLFILGNIYADTSTHALLQFKFPSGTMQASTACQVHSLVVIYIYIY